MFLPNKFTAFSTYTSQVWPCILSTENGISVIFVKILMAGPYPFGIHVNLRYSFTEKNLDAFDDVQLLVQSKMCLLDQLMS